MKKFLLSLLLLTIGAVVFRAEVKAQKVTIYTEGNYYEYINVDSVAYTRIEKDDFASRQWLTLEFKGKEAHVPDFQGQDMKWKIFWGDGQVSSLNATEKHTYTDDGPHTVTIRHTGISGFTLPLKAVQKVDITKF